MAAPHSYVHIGLENTGTTYLQKCLAASREKLSRHNVLYPLTYDVESHLELAAYAKDETSDDTVRIMAGLTRAEDTEPFRSNYERNLIEQLSKKQFQKVVFSSEHLSSRLVDKDEIARLKALLSRFSDKISVIVYLRRQDEVALSMYSTAVRGGWVNPISNPDERTALQRFDYRNILDTWSGIFGKDNLIIRIYNDEVRNDIVKDFCKVTSIDDNLVEKMAQSENARLDARKIEFLRLLNKYLPVVENGQLSQRRGNLAQMVEKSLRQALNLLFQARCPNLWNCFIRAICMWRIAI
ncbi:hypothetical protein [Rhizobium alvei]|uniref:Sulfotransferase domain-containing protein n=1 Tax=Rhizobium alvei TaxID=1132659 RepID=A0ABT8YQ60_9HYPH|nr:hypothetical protein [Rhizobium alvei]MDO6965498.1 hypothetical protein [Rhizobium alvei]